MFKLFSRRAFAALCVGSYFGFAACTGDNFSTDLINEDAMKIDARVDATLAQLYSDHPNIKNLADKSSGILVMPLVTEAGFGFGGSYGRGALRIGNVSVDYYSTASAGFGWQVGAQQYAHVLFFITEDALQSFRFSQGWAVTGDIEYAFRDRGENFRAETTTALSPVIAVIFGQSGLKIGATLEGTKYTRIIP